MQTVDSFKKIFLDYLNDSISVKEPKGLYEPIQYILALGGKRLRPIFTLVGASLFSEDFKRALPAALAVEIFHNFSLVHDDIMDEAPVRRGEITVHEKWDLNTGILSGDAMLIEAYQCFESYEPLVFKQLLQLFSTTAIQVCEGQQYDVDFEQMDEVPMPLYFKMIGYKTAVLLAAALKMGALVVEAPEEDAQSVYQFGLHLGIAFQLLDDYLDVYGDPKDFGKQIAGDILENKKTFLYLTALELADEQQRTLLRHYYSNSYVGEGQEKITKVTQLFNDLKVPEHTKSAIEEYTNKGIAALNNLAVSSDKKVYLTTLSKQLMKRFN